MVLAAVPGLAALFGPQQATSPHVASGTMPWAEVEEYEGRVLGPLAVVGDSNSVAPWFTPGWVEMAERLLGLEPGEIVNTSIPGATAGLHPELPVTKSGPEILDLALGTGVDFDGLIFALGTNDVSYGRDALQVMADLDLLIEQVETFDPEIQIFVALIPPLVEPVEGAAEIQDQIDALNASIVSTIPASHVIDFHSILSSGLLGTEFTYYSDGIHHNALASALKADAVVEVLSAAFGLLVAAK